MLSFADCGKPIAKIYDDVLFLRTDNDNCSDSEYDSEDDIGDEYETDDEVEPLLDMETRQVAYIAGPSGSGKSTMAVKMIKRFLKVHPDKQFFLFSRSSYKDDPAFRGMRVNQVMLDESLIKEPIDITKELPGGAIILFDDVNTILDDKIKKAVEKLMADIMEVGRKFGVWIVITSHLVIPSEKKFARTVMNEAQTLTVFPKSGSAQQISYALKQYFGLTKKQIDTIIQLPSRWVQISKSYPMYVVYEHGVYIL